MGRWRLWLSCRPGVVVSVGLEGGGLFVGRKGGYSGHCMQDSGAADDETDAGTPGEVAVGGGGVGGGLFIAEGDEFDVEGDAGFGDFDYGDADDAEDDFNAEGFEGLGD